MKDFEFASAAAKRAYLALPSHVQKRLGADLNAVQQGQDPFSSHKLLSQSVGAGAIELIENGSPAFRVVYCCKYLNTVFVLHAFEKTTNGVDQKEIDTAKSRYKELKQRVDAENKRAKKAVAPASKAKRAK